MPNVEQALSGNGLMIALLVALALINIWNVGYTALSNARKEKERQEAPLLALRGDISTLRNDLAADRERITALERDLELHSGELKDLHQGQTELCRGVQALLDHALHNGNGDEMQAASNSIGKWLRNR